MFGWCNGWCDLLMVNGEKGSKEIQPSQDEHVTTGDQKSLGINENPNAFGSVAATNKNSWVVRGLLVHWFLIGREGGTIWNEWGIYRSEATPGVSKHILVRKEFIVTFFWNQCSWGGWCLHQSLVFYWPFKGMIISWVLRIALVSLANPYNSALWNNQRIS